MESQHFIPTKDQTFKFDSRGDKSLDFRAISRKASELQASGDIASACSIRLEAAQALQAILPEDEEIILEWGDAPSRAAIELLYASAIDHFLIGDFEVSAALLEMMLDLDGEDHLEATNILTYNYLMMGEYELFDEIINDVSDKYASRMVMLLLSSFLRDGAFIPSELAAFKHRYAPYYEEFTASEHPADEAFVKDIESERPSKRAQARELWLQTEHLWRVHPNFIEALKQK